MKLPRVKEIDTCILNPLLLRGNSASKTLFYPEFETFDMARTKVCPILHLYQGTPLHELIILL